VDTVTRRRFLLASGVLGAGALAAGATQLSWHDVTAAAKSNPLPADANILVLVTLYGGNDSLNTVIPYADPAYHRARPDIAYAPEAVLHLDDQLGLNPALKGLYKLWQGKHLAILRGVGYPQPDHSHFRSMDIWQTASPTAPVSTGWIGRWLDATGTDPLRSVSVGATLPPLAVGAKSVGSSLPVGALRMPKGPLAARFPGLGRPDSTDTAAQSAAARGDSDFLLVARTLGPKTTAEKLPAAGAGSGGDLGAQLDVVKACITAGAPTRVYAVSLGGFDTHADEKGTQQALLGELDTAVSGFLTDLAGDPNGRKVVLAAYSEFGRRVAANASDGTDHGTAGTVLVAGTPVHGGFYGEQPSLTRLTDGDLIATTDFRAVYGTLLGRVLNTDPAKVLDRVPPAIPFV